MKSFVHFSYSLTEAVSTNENILLVALLAEKCTPNSCHKTRVRKKFTFRLKRTEGKVRATLHEGNMRLAEIAPTWSSGLQASVDVEADGGVYN